MSTRTQTLLGGNYFIQQALLQFIKEEKVNLKREIAWYVKEKWRDVLNCSMGQINHAISMIRQQVGLYPNRFRKTIEKPTRTKLNYMCLEDKQYRDSPRHEAIACDKMTKFIVRGGMPFGGYALYIGTPAPFSASDQFNYRMTCTDNFEVAIMLKNTSDQSKIVVGDLINPEKALLKAQEWKSLSSTNCCTVELMKVHRDTYKSEIHSAMFRMAKQLPVKVVLMNSGVWTFCEATRQRYQKMFPDIDFNRISFDFETPSMELSNRFDNLHILAMTRDPGEDDYRNFVVKYIHKGEVKIIP